MEALTILLEAPRLLAMATLGMDALVLLDLGLESMWVAVLDGLHRGLAFLVALSVRAIGALAIGTTAEP